MDTETPEGPSRNPLMRMLMLATWMSVLTSLVGSDSARAAAPTPIIHWAETPPSPTIVFKTTPGNFAPSFQADTCQKMECFLTFTDKDGEILRINQRTGAVTLVHPEKMDETARRFWMTVTKVFHQLKCAP